MSVRDKTPTDGPFPPLGFVQIEKFSVDILPATSWQALIFVCIRAQVLSDYLAGVAADLVPPRTSVCGGTKSAEAYRIR